MQRKRNAALVTWVAADEMLKGTPLGACLEAAQVPTTRHNDGRLPQFLLRARRHARASGPDKRRYRPKPKKSAAS